MRYVAFLRGMNLGGRRITNDELCGCFEELGFRDPWAFLASGNVVFEASSGTRAHLAKRVETGLGDSLGYAVPTFLRSERQVASIAAADPFGTSEGASGGKLQVALLARKPGAARVREALALATADDRLAVEGEEMYWLPKGGMSDSDLDLKGLERALGAMTVRTRRTLERLAKKLGE